MKKVSIVMPVYNGKEYIRESIESIINQTYPNWEFIIVNEYGSDDGSKEIIMEYAKKDERIKLIQNTKREGIAASLNIGLKASSGDYIARMDSDDISGTERLEKQVKYLDSNPSIGLCGIQPEFIGTKEIYWELEKNPEQIRNNIFFYTPCVHPTVMFRREIVDKYKILYNEEYKATEDYDFFSRVVGVLDIANIDDKSLFKYRMYENNATNRNNNIGLVIYSKVMKHCFKEYLDLDFSDDEINLLDCHISTSELSGDELYEAVVKLDLLLKKILLATKTHKEYKIEYMFKTLKKRWNELRWSIPESCKTSAVNFLIDKSIFNRESFSYEVPKNIKEDITILMPVYNSEKYILDSVLSITNQTYKDFLLLIMIEHNNNDNTEEYLSLIKDPRIKVITNKTKLGLAKTLNEGIKIAKTKYIARMDSDDLSVPTRLEKERNYLEEHDEISLVCSWQRHFGSFGTYIHKSESAPEDLKASLLFKCDVCHSTVMFRTDVMKENNYFYNEEMAMEDFDLWNRMLDKENICCLPEVLGEYRIHGENITQFKHQKVIDSEITVISRNLSKLGIEPGSYDKRLLIGWDNIYQDNLELKKKASKLFDRIIKQNKKYQIYSEKSLIKILNKRMAWIDGKEDYILEKPQKEAFKSKMKIGIKKVIKPVVWPAYSRIMNRVDNKINEKVYEKEELLNRKIEDQAKSSREKIEDQAKSNSEKIEELIKSSSERIEELSKSSSEKIAELDKKNSELLNDIYNAINKEKNDLITIIKEQEKKISNGEKELTRLKNENDKFLSALSKYINPEVLNKYRDYDGGKIRLGLVFQVPSFWPSIESVYNALLNDDRFDFRFFLLDLSYKEPSQMNGAKDFLEMNNIKYELLTTEKLDEFEPHALIIQTPYDEWHRTSEFSSKILKEKHIRLIYIPYGIEIGGSQESLKYQFNSEFFNNMWRIYTLSEVTQKYFCIYSNLTIDEVKALGHPKFDGIINKKYTTNYDFKKLANGKKIVLVKIHFPIKFNDYVVTPDMKVYLDLLDNIEEYKDIYFIFMLHPLMFDDDKNSLSKELVEKIKNTKNIMVFKDDDYREPLLFSDAFICDRSSIAVEIGSLHKPVLFIERDKDKEILIDEFDRLFSSYEKGTSYNDIHKFLLNVNKGLDLNKDKRDIEVHKCIHLCDGKSAERIIEDIYNGIIQSK